MARIVILGGGPAGYEAALVAAQHGAEVTVVEREGYGGACVLYDCVPSKTFISSAGVRVSLRRATDLGIRADWEQLGVDVPVVHRRVKGLALAQSADVRARLEQEGVRLLAGHGRLSDVRPGLASHRVDVQTPAGAVERLDADFVLLATGASPRILPGAVPDGERILTWRQIYDLGELPTDLVVVGSGVTGAEFVSAYAELGTKVTLVSSRARVLPARTPKPPRCSRRSSPTAVSRSSSRPGPRRWSAPRTGWSCTSPTGAR